MANDNPAHDSLREYDLKDVDLARNKEHQGVFTSELFPVYPADFKDHIGIFHPLVVYQSYFTAIADELAVFTPEEHLIKTIGDLFDILDVLRQSFCQPKHHVLELITASARQRGRHDEGLSEKVEASVELAVKVWFLADVQTYAKRLGDAANQPWHATQSLSNYIAATVCEDPGKPLDDNPYRRFSRRLTLFDMDWLSLIKIKWTNNIAQHLYLEEWKDRTYNRTIYVFSHTAMMESIVQDPRLANDSNGIKDFLKETMDTVDLLMDLQDPEARQWYRKVRKRDNAQREKMQLSTEALDIFAGFPKRKNSLLSSNASELRRVGHYRHWQQRLLRLEKAFKESTPSTVQGYFRDRRNSAIWVTILTDGSTLLLTFLALTFTLASVLTGTMSLDLAKKANSLANDTKALAEEANDLARQELLQQCESTNKKKRTETQTVIVVVQGGYCDCAKGQVGGSKETGMEEWLAKILEAEQVAALTTHATATDD